MMGKTKTKTLIISFLLAAVAACLSIALVACSSDDGEKDTRVYNVGEEGVYYYDATSSAEYLMTLQSGTYMISTDGAKGYSGTYSYDETAGAIAFTDSSGEKFEAAFSDDAMQLAIAGTDYTFLKKVDYIVEFKDGSSTVGTQSVTYGKNASKIDAEKDGYIFIGWYEDATFTTQYKFNTAVTANTTLYAYYIPVDTTIANFEVQFVSGGDIIYTTTTQNGVVYDFPETEVAGWWVSATNNADELTYEYKGEILTEATKLFAVESYSLGASVYADGLKWNTAVATATIMVDGAEITSSATGASFAYDFDSLSAGRHEITISSSGASESLVYVAKALSRVSNFSVYGTTLVYNAVENAQYYYVSVTCGNTSHDHEMVYNGNTLTYDFSNCEMGPEGISFTVYAYAQGYVESVSETFVYALILDGTSVTIDSSSDTATWTAVADATGYEVYVNGTLAATTTGTEYSLKHYDVNEKIVVSVKPVAPGYYSEESTAAEYTKATLRAPEITSVSGYEISWEKIDGAASYELNINGYLVTVEPKDDKSEAPTTYVISDTALGYIFSDARNAVSVMAIGATASENSQYGDMTYVTDAVMGSALSYADGTVTWDYALAASSYTVELDGEAVGTVSGVNSYGITFTHSGESEIKVYFNDSSFASLTVYTYAIIFDSQGADLVDTVYVAKGDTVTLPVPVMSSGAKTNFVGWYTLPDTEATENSVEYGGKGVLCEATFVFTGNSTMVLYAFFTGTIFTVTLDAGEYGIIGGDEETQSVLLGSTTYTLPVPALSDTTKVFLGWYSQRDGGIPYTDENGGAVTAVTETSSETFYARYGTAITLSLSRYENNQVLEAKKGPDIEYIQDGVLTIPATYTVGGTEYPVAVISSGAFTNCAYIKEVNIPDTVLYVSTTNNGYSSGTGAFAQSGSIEAVNVYATEDPGEIRYYSDDGVLFSYSETSSGASLIYYPQGKTNANYEVPETVSDENEYEYGEGLQQVHVVRNVTSIATKVFSQHPSLVNVTVPATVESIDSQAFYKCAKLESVVMLAKVSDADATAAATLSVAGDAFKSCAALSSVTFASRLESFDYNMFEECSSLTNVYVNSTGDPSVDNYSSSEGTLVNAAGNTLVYYPIGRTEFSLTDTNITKIGENAVYKNKNIKTVTIPDWVTEIGESAFYGCSGMTTLTFASLNNANANALTIRTQAFYSCTALTTLTLPQNCTTIEKYAFGELRSLTKVWFDSSEETLSFADGAFSSTSGVYYDFKVEIGPNAPAISISAVFGYVISEVEIDPANGNYDSSVAGVILDGEGTEVLYCLANYTGAVILPEGIEKLGENAFRSRSITSIEIPASVSEIGNSAFYNCKYLTTVTFAERTDGQELKIGDYAFYGCSSLKEINSASTAGASFPEGLAEIGTYVFYGCMKLESLVLPEGLTKIGDYAFYNCRALTSLYIPATLEEMGSMSYGVYYLFYGCSGLSLEIADGSEYFAYADGILYGLSAAASDGVAEPADEEADLYAKTAIYIALEAAEGEVVLPATTQGIAYRAFYNNMNITSVKFGGALTSTLTIGSDAFAGCKQLVSVELPEGLTSLAAGVFTDCSALEKIVIPSTVTSMANKVFSGCSSLKEVEFTEGGTEDLVFASGTNSSYVFYGTAIEEITLPARMTSISDFAFYNLSSLKKVTIPYTVKSIGETVFGSCTNLSEIVIEDDVDNGRASVLTTIGRAAFWATGIETITLPDSVTTITGGRYYSLNMSSASAFGGCESLKTITIPAGVTEISDELFYGCTSLESVTIQGSSVKVGEGAVADDIEFKELILKDGASISTIDDEAFYGCTALKSITLSSATTSIGESAFEESGLESVEIPGSTTKIDDWAFSECMSLTSVTFGTYTIGTYTASALTTIGDYAFYKCPLTNLTLPESYSELKIGMYAFASNESLTTVSLSSSVKGVYYVFYGSENITSMTVADGGYYTVKTLSDGAILLLSDAAGNGSTAYTLEAAFNVNGTLNLTNSDIVAVGDSALAGNTKLTGVTIPYTMTYIARNAFYGCSNLATVTFEALPSGYNASGYVLTLVAGNGGNAADKECGVFAYCTSLTSVELPERLVTLPAYTFSGCTALSSVSIPSTVTTIEGYAFGTSSNLATVTIADGSALTGIGAYAFYNCSALTSISLPSGVTTLSGDYIFAGCTALSSVTFAASAITLSGNYIFQNCASLTSGAFQNKTLNITGTYTFQNCSSLTSISLEGMTAIPEGTFSGTGLTTVTIPATVTSIGNSAFAKCASLTAVVFEANATGTAGTALSLATGTSSTGVFGGCTALTTVVLSDRVTSVPAYAFNGCTALTVVTYTDDAGYDENSNDYAAVGYFALMDGVTLGDYAFAGSGLIFADISNLAEEEIGTYVFSGCVSLASVEISDDMTSIPEGLLNGCSAITEFSVGENITSIGKYALAGTSITTITLPSAITEIEDGTFSGCEELSEVIYEEGQITTVGASAFANCSSLTSLDLSGLTALSGTYAFQASGLTEAILPALEITSETAADAEGAFKDCAGLAEVELSTSLTYLPASMFQNASSLKKIYYTGYEGEDNVLPSSLETMGTAVFAGSGLESIVIPGTLATITAGSTGMFQGCEELVTVVMENGVDAIGYNAFMNCTALEYVSIPYTVTSIGYASFYNCTALAQIDFESLPVDKSVTDYPLTINGGTTTSSNYGAFYKCTSLIDVVLPERLDTVGTWAFGECTSLESVYIPSTVTSMHYKYVTNYISYTFDGCTSLKTVTFAPGVSMTYVGQYMFTNCTSLETIALPDTVTNIDSNAFQYCSSLTSIELSSSLTTISSLAFQYSGLEEITIPASCTSIGSRVFSYCPNLVNIEVEETNPSYVSVDGVLASSSYAIISYPTGREGEAVIDDELTLTTSYAFLGCSKLTRVVFGNSCESVATYVFQDCTALEEVVISNVTTTISQYAFNNDSALERVYYMGTAEEWDTYLSITTGSNTYFINAPKYWLSETEPAFNNDGTDYDDNYWYYDENGDITVWTFGYATYSVENGGYVLYDGAADAVVFVCLTEDGEPVVYTVVTSTKTDTGYTVVLDNGTSYTVALSDTGATLTAVQ